MGFVVNVNDGLPTIEKVSTSRLDYSFNFQRWLAAVSDSIVSFVISADEGITIDESFEVQGIVTAFMLGGDIGQSYTVTCKITTLDERIDSRSMVIQVIAER